MKPIASKPPYAIKAFVEASSVYWPGRLSAVLFLAGCNFRCPYCYSGDLVFGDQPNLPFLSVLEDLRSHKTWVTSVCVTGGEPTVHSYLPEILAALKSEGFQTKLDTNGSHPVLLKGLIDSHLVDYVAMDVKAPLNLFSYAHCAGVVPQLEDIEKSIRMLMKGGSPYQFRTTILPKLHTVEEVLRISEQLSGAMEYRLQSFHPGKTLDPSFRNVAPYDPTALRELQERCHDIVTLAALETRLRA